MGRLQVSHPNSQTTHRSWIGLIGTTGHLATLSSIARLELFSCSFGRRFEGLSEDNDDNRGSGHIATGETGITRKRRPPRTLYRGDPGMWSWVLHRISGATIFFFLFVHVLDAAMLRVSPQTYNEVMATYKTPIVGLMEFGLVAAVLFHGAERRSGSS